MCLICLDFQREKMTLLEARRAFGEMIVGMKPEHAREVDEMLREAEKRQASADPAPTPAAPCANASGTDNVD